MQFAFHPVTETAIAKLLRNGRAPSLPVVAALRGGARCFLFRGTAIGMEDATDLGQICVSVRHLLTRQGSEDDLVCETNRKVPSGHLTL